MENVVNVVAAISHHESERLDLLQTSCTFVEGFLVPFSFLRLFCRMRNRSLVSECEFTHLVDRSVS